MKKLPNSHINIHWNLEVNSKSLLDYSEKHKYVTMNTEEGKIYATKIKFGKKKQPFLKVFRRKQNPRKSQLIRM